MQVKPQTVSEIIGSVKKTIEGEFSDVTVVGEISNLSLSSAGHYYFNLSDHDSSISCALFKMDAFRNPAIRKIKNGDEVLIRGPISLYTKRGTFQIIAKRVLPFGVGNLMAQYELLKEKLRNEGLFDVDRKLKFPSFVKKVAVITALRGAALQDFLNVYKRRSLGHHIVIVPSIMQGDECALSVIKAIEKARKLTPDAIVITRGGGSMEDLWGFNDENLVRSVSHLDIPVISAIGHQVDYTLLDFVADYRCETPSTAAEFLTQSQIDLNHRLILSLKDFKSLFLEFKNNVVRRIDKVNPVKVIHHLKQDLYQKKIRLEKMSSFAKGDVVKVHEHYQYIDEMLSAIRKSVQLKFEKFNYQLSLNEKSLNSLNPNNVLSRGYAYIQTEDGRVISTVKEFDNLNLNDRLYTHFQDGKRIVQKVDE